MNINKKDLIRLLEKIVTYLELKGENPFRINAYRKAAQSLEKDVRSIQQIDDFMTLSGIGKGTNEIITEYIRTGESSFLKTLQTEVPEGLIPLLKLPGLGGKRLATLYQQLNITDADSLKQACTNGDIYQVKGFGEKTVTNILQGLEDLGTRPERIAINHMLHLAKEIERFLEGIPHIQRYDVAGSVRRLEEKVKDIDYIIATNEPDKVREALLQMDHIKEIIANGDTKISFMVGAEYDVQIDFRLVNEAEYATTLHHFTGSKDHNVLMRQIAKQQQKKINEYGVEDLITNETSQFQTEEQFFKHFDLNYIPPELRQGKDETEKFTENIELLTLESIKGDLHMHTTWSDGAQSVEEMVQKARSLGYEYMAITDHSKFLRIANGLTENRLREQREEIARLNDQYDDIHIFAGVEMDILPSGELDFSTEFLKEMDLVIAAIHSSFSQTEEEIMTRLFHALENPYVDIVAHPTGRIIGRRQGYAINIEKLIKKAKETNTALELNANPQRFDLAPKALEIAKENGVMIAINTDAHDIRTFDHMKYGVKVARKAWLQNEHVLNTWDTEKMTKFLQRNK